VISEARRKQLSFAGRLGAYALWSRHPDRVPDVSVANEAREASYSIGHGGHPDDYAHLRRVERPVGLCVVCPKRIEVPPNLDDDQRDRVIADLRTRHYRNLAKRAVAARRRTG
jgi:hypothetical protein